MLQGEHSVILSTFIKLPFVIKIFVLSIFEWLFYTGFTVYAETSLHLFIHKHQFGKLSNDMVQIRVSLLYDKNVMSAKTLDISVAMEAKFKL